MLTNNTKRQSGFTIIEVLIVLAIAGLILLIVFLAVPALQRNSRNTQAKNAAASVLSVVNEFVNNNNGQLPSGPTNPIGADGTVTISGATGTTDATGKVQPGYNASYGSAMPSAAGNYVIYVNRKCNGTAFASAATPRAIAIGYLVETSGSGTAQQCTET